MTGLAYYTFAIKTGGSSYLVRYALDILFLSNHNIHKSSSGPYFWASDPLDERFL